MNFFLGGLEIQKEAVLFHLLLNAKESQQFTPKKRFLSLLDKVWNWTMLFSVKTASKICIDNGVSSLKIFQGNKK